MKANFFPSNLLLIRKKAEINQRVLADALGVSTNMVSYYENGQSDPNTSMLLKISDYFNINLDDLIAKDLSKDSTKIPANLSANLSAKTQNQNRKNYVSEPSEAYESRSSNAKEILEMKNLYRDLLTLKDEIIQAKDQVIKSKEAQIKALEAQIQLLQSIIPPDILKQHKPPI